MKPASLSLRLGLTMSILGALLVMFLAVLAYFALTHEAQYAVPGQSGQQDGAD